MSWSSSSRLCDAGGALLLASFCAGTAAGAAEPLPLYGEWRSFGRAEGLPADKVFCVLAEEDVVWVGTEAGLGAMRGGRVEVVAGGPVYPVVTALALSERSGDLWVGTLGGLSRLSGGRFESFTQMDSGLINDVIYAIEVVGDDVWVATAAGLSVYHSTEGSWELFDHRNTLMHEPWCYGVTASRTHLYVAAWGGGVIERDFAGGVWREYRDPDHEMEIDLFRDDGLIHDITSAIDYADPILWVGTYFGLSRYDGRAWMSFMEHDSGLPSNFINAVRAEGRWAWICTDRGLAAFDGSTWVAYGRRGEGGDAGGVIRVFEGSRLLKTIERERALPHEFVLGVDVRGNDIWVATSAGLSRGARLAEQGTDNGLEEGNE